MIATGAVTGPFAVATVTLSPLTLTRSAGAPKRTSAPRAWASRSIAAIARSGSSTPAAAWYMTEPPGP